MKRGLSINLILLCLMIVYLTSCISGVTPKVEPGNWQWRNANGSINTSTAINVPVTINTSYDVWSLRWQFLITITNSNSSNAIVNLNPYLQYLDAGSSSGSGNITMPMSTNRYAGDNQPNGSSFDRFSGNGGTISTSLFSSGYYATANWSQTDGWHTLSDEGTVYTGSINGSSNNANYTSGNAAFVLSSYAASTTSLSSSTISTVSNNPEYTTLSYSTNPSYSASILGNTNNAQIIVPSTNGSSVSNMVPSSVESSLPIVLSVNPNSTSIILLETEFHIKPAVNASNTAIGPKAGDRYFFRLRAFGSVGLGTYSSSTKQVTFTSSRSDFYLSPYGVGGGGSSDPNASYSVNDGSDATYGFYRNNTAPFPYLDITSNIYSYTLPVNYSKDLHATLQNKNVLLTWSTGTEINNRYFDLQRKSNDGEWISVGHINSKYTNGSGDGVDYSFIDHYPTVGKLFYRLVQYDQDNKSTMSNVASIDVASPFLTIAPNPVIDRFRLIGVAAGSILNIYNILGQLIKNQTIMSQQYLVDVGSIPSGVYIIKVVEKSGATQSIKFVKK